MVEKEKAIFNFLDQEEKEKETTDGEGNTPKETQTLAPEIQAIIKENAENKKKLEALEKKNEELTEVTKVTTKLRDAFSDKPASDDDAADRESFAADSYGYTKAQLKRIEDKAIERAEQITAPLKIDAIVRTAQRELSKRYVVQIDGQEAEWEDPRVQAKVGAELRLLDKEFKQSKPREAMRRAAWAAGVLKERTDELPGYESGYSPQRVMSPDQRKKADEAEKAALRNAGGGGGRIFANI